ncbi:hypothetical protein C3747_7g188 [Trypanosoma cruzi]|uniref:Uncharacterized protein n=1 Tax=Trypanosoma cruzi TaxID=5693 RepID=A0A2V2XJG2_TRYCR|nr:hypothetical protein C3747_7g188 [Trypanosoma cruzi]
MYCGCCSGNGGVHTFLSVKLSNAHSSEEAEHFSDTFTMSHISLLGHLARSDPERAAESLCLSLEALQGRNANLEQHLSGSDRLQVQEGIWLVLKIIDAFLADACEGEEVSIPSCFTGSFRSGSHPVLKVVSTLMVLMQEVERNLSVASPALVSSLWRCLVHSLAFTSLQMMVVLREIFFLLKYALLSFRMCFTRCVHFLLMRTLHLPGAGCLI